MLSTRIFAGIYRQTSNYNAAPILSLLNRNQFYSMNCNDNITRFLANKNHTNVLNRKVSVTSLDNLQNRYVAELPSTTIVRYKSNLPTELPSGDQLQKYFFKILGFVLDISKTIICWTIKIIQTIMNHPKTKQYWARLQNKIEDARKN
ncbi:uncharacterized protein LOC129610356 [Condylostylus longicornis]|uniref:uncharacterized protein LOC129610356 n=1 Tax=Condylostylus longicornis TaxID=2530218 RepID=UPI00244DF353|nr:uncharacterized protein LOC129610356 [Condylostylus longicornis]